jgi:diaminohydroxyphosphoribosylaminopyrimidine deaminase/5-amino-6-(5-phosphoribosylamino)uracil reductase
VIGGPRTAVADVGVATIADALRYDFADLVRLGDDLLVIARPRSVAQPETLTREKA